MPVFHHLEHVTKARETPLQLASSCAMSPNRSHVIRVILELA